MIAFRGLGLAWEGRPPVFAAFDLEVRPGEILALTGPSGCGKTSLVKAAAGLWSPATPGLGWSGTVEGRDPGSTALILQDLGLLPWKTVEENISLPLTWRGLAPAEVRSRTDSLVDELGLGNHRRAWPAQLSGGLAQRTALARALALRPRLLLLDEPFSALDALTRERAQDLLWDLWRAHGPTVILVTHSADEAAALAHRAAVLGPGAPARLEALVDLPGAGEAPALRRPRPAHHQAVQTLRAALAAGASL